ncbi:ubiquitin [Sporanaerobium hydrogeniformans]|uniref:Ubiquitin n=1 Tax=Sporanaerobium hydrogeniformans TaxID=3072179 RepID=A0AC61D754_9FIRM|nr:DUF4342 domain-containing protein [Sporanaerobium hydrogeniformans]PHV69390.1 ubiquitin [Sporanaerobium hydrogeniformans]
MGTITIEQIDLIMARAHVTYAEAKEALEKSDGDVVEALLYLEKTAKLKSAPQPEPTPSQKVTSFIDKLNATRFILSKKGHTYVNVPLSIALILIICTLYISLITLLIAIVFGVKIQVKGDNDIAEKINSTIDNISK